MAPVEDDLFKQVLGNGVLAGSETVRRGGIVELSISEVFVQEAVLKINLPFTLCAH
jgi:hypothetical protein